MIDRRDRIAAPPGTVNTLCWCCRNAYGGCSWMRKPAVPVKGWDAVRQDMLITYYCPGKNVRRWSESYVVLRCPLFRLDPRSREEYRRFHPEKARRQAIANGGRECESG